MLDVENIDNFSQFVHLTSFKTPIITLIGIRVKTKDFSAQTLTITSRFPNPDFFYQLWSELSARVS